MASGVSQSGPETQSELLVPIPAYALFCVKSNLVCRVRERRGLHPILNPPPATEVNNALVSQMHERPPQQADVLPARKILRIARPGKYL